MGLARFGPILFVVALLLAGCGDSETDLAPVRGTITLDGKPLIDASVEFEPRTERTSYGKTSASPSYGKTDAKGRYKLRFNHEETGAMIGTHIVRIRTRDETVDSDGNEVIVPERLPPKFNFESELTAEVEAGSNTIDFDLELESPAASGN